MRVGVCLVAAGVLLSGCTSSGPTGKEVVAGGLAEKQVTSGTASAAAPQRAQSNDNCVTAWEQNAYHYACDPNANY
jgi:hypothetical protein